MSWLEAAKSQCYDFVFAKPIKQISAKTSYLKWFMIFCILTSVSSMILCFYMYQNVKSMKQYMVYYRHPSYNTIKSCAPP
jgi:hypothetical protein